jgi:para-nitrobenzyl esterase
MNSQPVAETRAGRVRGLRLGGVEVFRGVPYGAPTGGANRFRPPVPPAPWTGILEATEPGLRAPQSELPGGTDFEHVFDRSQLSGPWSEDCLRLNVFTAASGDGGLRPVLFWIHGGFYTFGSGNGPIYDGSNLAATGEVVVVSVTHRLNLFGYMHLGGAGTEDFGQSANVGQLDLVQALEWVRDNITAFGGDPDRVTIFGESGGGRKCAVLMAMPAARGLFHRAILQSGPGAAAAPLDYAERLTDAVLAEVGVSRAEAAKLQAAPAETLMAAHAKVAASRLGRTILPGFVLGGFSAVVDGQVLPAHPFAPAATPLAADVPVIIGSNRDEQALFLAMADPEVRAGTLTEAALLDRLSRSPRGPEVLTAYKARRPGATPAELQIAIETDRTYWIHSVRLAERKAAQAAAVYMYRFDWPALDGRLKACHGLEIPFVFDNLQAVRGLVGDAGETLDLARNISRAWIAFAKTGCPQHTGIPDWPAYDAAARQTMIIDRDWRMDADPDGWARRLWDELDGDGVAV